MIRVLYIAHNFPPIGGAGTQRSLKFVKYLPGFGVMPTVLTGEGRVAGRWSPEDHTMLAEVPAEVEIVRASWDGGREARRRALVVAGEAAVENHGAELILVSMSPFEDASVASDLAHRLDLPWVADLRDPWALDEFQVHRTRWHRRRERAAMSAALQGAALIVMNTPEAATRVRRCLPGLKGSPVVSLTNGYDAEDFAGSLPEPAEGRFTILHNGYLHAEGGLDRRRKAFRHRVLGSSIAGVRSLSRSHYFLLQALERWCREDPRAADLARLELVGSLTDVDRRLVGDSEVAGMVRFPGYLDHRDSIDRLKAADLLFLPLHTVPAGMRTGIVPGKTYEYMASQRPILAAVPDGDARDFLEAAGTAECCEPEDVDGMLRILRKHFGQWQDGEAGPECNWPMVERFERRRLAADLAGHLKGCLRGGSGASRARVDLRMMSPTTEPMPKAEDGAAGRGLPRVCVAMRWFGVRSEIWAWRQVRLFSRLRPQVLSWTHENRDDFPLGKVPIDLMGTPEDPNAGRGRWSWRLRNLPGGNFYGSQGGELKQIIAGWRASRPEVVLCHFGHVGLRFLPAARRLGIPLVVHFHGQDISSGLTNRWYRWSLRSQAKHFAAVVCVGSHQRELLLELGVPPDRIHLIPCGVPIDEFEPVPRSAHRDEIRFIGVSRLVEWKGQHIALEAFARVADKVENARLTIVGDGPENEVLRRRAGELGLGERVWFAGSRPAVEVKRMLAESDVFLQHSLTHASGWVEGFGVAIAEASATGLPVVVSASGGITDQVIDGVTGLVVEERDVDAMAGAMLELARDPSARRRMGAEGRQRMVEHFDTAGQVRRLEDVLLAAAGVGKNSR